jgi:hypothetical protein
LDQDEIIEILDQTEAPEWHEAMVNAIIYIIYMSYQESVSFSKSFVNLVKIRRTNSPGPATISVEPKKRVSVTRSVGKYSKNPKSSNMWCLYCDKNNHNTVDCREISKFKQQKKVTFLSQRWSQKEVFGLPCSF